MIHTSLSPNTESDDLCLGFKYLFNPLQWYQWKKGEGTKNFEEALQKYLGKNYAFSFQRGRDALYVLIQSLSIGHGDEVILQAYTCIVVPNAIQYTGAKPVYVDIEEDGFNIDPKLIEAKITKKTKAIIIQHTFGEVADIEAVLAICKKHKLFLIEDCAHSLSGLYKVKKLGTFGDAAIWSFGRDKIISSVWGGMITTDDDKLAEKIKEMQNKLPYPSRVQIAQALLHPLVFALAKPFYQIKLGKVLIYFSQLIGLIPRVIFPKEKQGEKPEFFPQKMPSVLARLAHHQLKKLERFHKHRRDLAVYYTKELQGIDSLVLPATSPNAAWLRYTIRSTKAAKILEEGKKQGIYLGDWYRRVLAPEDCQLRNFGYELGDCPRAEKAAEETLNLPTHIQVDKRKRRKVVEFVKINI